MQNARVTAGVSSVEALLSQYQAARLRRHAPMPPSADINSQPAAGSGTALTVTSSKPPLKAASPNCTDCAKPSHVSDAAPQKQYAESTQPPFVALGSSVSEASSEPVPLSPDQT